MTIRLKACPRCGGDVALERGLGTFQAMVCLQCGHETESNGQPEVSVHRGDFLRNEGRGRKVPPRKGAA